MRAWLSGRASPCQGEGRQFESGRPLQTNPLVTGGFAFSQPSNVCSSHPRRAIFGPCVELLCGDNVQRMSVDEPLNALSIAKPFAQALLSCPRNPGLYAFYGDGECWKTLRLSGYDGRALYVGKSESSLVTRDLEGHFFAEPEWGGNATSPTGHSTLRRSVAALLGFEAIPRNPNKPERRYAPMFGLSPKDDVDLGLWMQSHLQLAVWTPSEAVVLALIENEVKAAWLPPLNLDIRTPWKTFVRDERAKLTAQVRSYPPVA
ncbi:hypothetical protein BH20ACT23_BH20ACT23_17500 [soil metagenome]